jgi:hypothetical protein
MVTTMGRIEKLLTDEERKILRFYVEYSERLEGFTKLLKKLNRLGDLTQLHQDIELIENFRQKFNTTSS